MKKYYTFVYIISLVFGLCKLNSQNSGIYESYVIIDSGFGNNLYDLFSATDTTADTDAFNFNLAPLGTFGTTTGTLILNGGQNNVWKCIATDNITSGWLNYIIYETGNRPGTPTFIGIDLSTIVNDYEDAACSGNGNNQEWITNNANIDILNGLSPGNYTLEVYTLADYTINGSDQTPYYVNNNGGNFTANFMVCDDTAGPTFVSPPADVIIECDASIPAMTDLTWNDDCDGTGIVTGVDSSTQTNDGSCTDNSYTITRTWTYTDSDGIDGSTSQTITVQDTTNPVFAGVPANTTVECNAIPGAASPTATDNCDTNVTITFNETITAGACPDAYTITRTWTATDNCGNTDLGVQSITVVDTTDPVLSGQGADANVECSDPMVFTPPTATDNCDASPNITFSDNTTTNACGLDTVTRTWTATDCTGNTSATVSQTLTFIDTTDPVLSGQGADANVECSDPMVFTPPTATDNCDASPNITFSDNTTTNACGLDTVTRTWTATDCTGNTSATVSQTLTFIDTTNPVLSGQGADANVECSDPMVFTPPTATDNCDASPNITFSDNTTTNACGLDTVTRTWTATDCTGNTSATVSQTLTFIDTTNPVLSGQGADANVECSDPMVFTPPTATDNCDASPNITFSDNTTTNACGLDTVTRTWTATDCTGNTSATVSQTLTFIDTTNPVLSGQGADANVECSDPMVFTPPTATDNCDASPNITFSDNTTTNACGLDTVTRTWTATDCTGNTSATVSQTLTFIDTTDPVLSGQGADANVECSDPMVFTPPTATDNCDASPNITFSDNTTTNACGLDTVTRTWTATDCTGNTSATVSQTLTFIDTTNPVLSGQGADANVECSDPMVFTPPTATDNCDASPNITFSDNTTTNACGLDTVTRTWTATDCTGNTSATVSQTLTFIDTTNPVLSGQGADANVECSDPMVFTPPTATDNCDASPNITFSDNTTTNACGLDTVTRTWTATDCTGNTSATVSQTLTFIDTTDPVLSGQGADANVECSDPMVFTPPTATDNCDASPNITFSDNTTTNACGLDTVTRTWTATDCTGNTSATVSQTLTFIDTTDPVLSGQGADANVECSDPMVFTPPTATDNCDASPNITFSDNTTTNACGLDTVTRTWTATDCTGNTSATVSQTLTFIDTTNPVLSGQGADANVECSDPMVFTPPTATDNCDASPNITFSDNTTTNACGLDTVTRTWTATDCTGNTSATVSQTLTFIDTTDPVLSGQGADANVECSDPMVFTPPTATDNCDASPNITFSDNTTTNACGLDTVTRTWTATDCTGNTSATVSQTLTFIDTTNPVITTCLGNQTVSFDNNCEYSLPDYTSSIVATDNCGSVAITQSPVSGTIISNTTTITITATDDCGNTSTCNFDVITNDTTNPTALCQNITIPLDDTGNVTVFPADIDNGSNDNCGIATRVVAPSSFTCADIGDNIVTLTVTDTSGNIATCNATVTIEDVTPPNASCGSITVTLDSVTGLYTLNNAEINSLYTGSGDTCGSETLSLAQTTFECDDIGTNAVVLTITDPSGNSSTCSASITVEAPIITSGTLTGIVVDPVPANPVPADDLIEVTACPGGVSEPKDVELTLTLDGSSTIVAANIQTWQISTDNGETWNNVAGTSGLLQYTLLDLLETTLVRLVIQSGDCVEYSPLAVVRFLPPDVPPTIVSVSNTQICLGDTVDIEAESFFEGPGGGQWGDGGLFNHAQPDGWRVDGEDGEFPASGDNQSEPTWKETNGPTYPGGIRYDTSDNTKFAIAWGPYTTTLETPIFHTVGMTAAEAIMEFHHAYYFCNGAQGIIELSLDGGDTYGIILNTMQGDNLTSPSDSGTQVTGKNGTNCGGGPNGQKPTSDPFQLAQLDLGAYVSMSNLRIRFTYDGLGHGRCNGQTFSAHPDNQCNSIPSNFNVWSTWAIDDVGFPYAYIEEELEWTDEEGVVIATGANISVTPVTPGLREYGVTSLVNGCRADGDDGTEFIDIYTSLAYAGQDFTPAGGDCGQSLINLKAYDNTTTALDNYNDGSWETGLYIYPGQSYDHDNNAGTPNIIAGNYPGTGVTGTWSAVPISAGSCGTSALFSSNTNPRATFTADPGTYRLRWTLTNGCFDEIDVTITSCDYINFDGVDDFVTLRNNYSINSAFSIEAWIKPNNISGTRTVFSKRNNNETDSGYNLNVEGGTVKFYWYSATGNGVITAQYPISTSRWYHLAVTFDGATYLLYVDGISVGQVTGTVRAPDTTSANVEALIGAIDQDNGSNNNVGNFFNGWIDELKIWNQALTVNQIRMMMNQEIIDNTMVRGEVIPMDVEGLNWGSLDGYYRMGINCGNLNAYKGASGRLRNINSPQEETAPLPYTSRVDSQYWGTDNTWTQFNVWDPPNSLGIDNNTPIDWNIVQISHDINSGNKDITVLGLISDTANKELTISDPATPQIETNEGQMLWITHYLKLDGKLDLVGESQLVQKRYNANQINGSIFDNTSLGYGERDQQGTANAFNYNYLSSPFAPGNASINNEITSNTYSIGDVLRDGTTTVSDPINRFIIWTANNTAAGGDPTEVSTRWLYAYNDNAGNTYSEWEYLNNSGTLNIGLGFTMKGSGNAPPPTTLEQNYVFVGKINNGTILNNVSPEVAGLPNDILLGNPYPSAIDALEFIKDNIPLLNPDGSASTANSDSSESINGTLYYWDHYNNNDTHILRDYQGGYAVYNLAGGVIALTPPPTEDGVNIAGGSGTISPNQFIPVAQGFFVTGSPTGGLIKFENDQRVYKREGALDGNSSIFFGANNGSNRTSSNSANETTDVIQSIRLNFKSPEEANRALLISFTPNNEADDGYNYGYDAQNYDDFPSDLSWSINNEKYIIQGVGVFDDTKKYPFILELGINGTFEVSLVALENFDTSIEVYIYDSLLDTYTLFNDTPFKWTMDLGDYMNRFYLAFKNENLSIPETDIEALRVNYLNDTNEIYINWINSNDIKEVELINIIGQTVKTWTNLEPINSNEIKIPVKNISEGNYVIKVINNQGMTTNKKVIIKQ